MEAKILKVLLPAYESSFHPNFASHALDEIRKAGIVYDLIMLVNRDHRIGELPARNKLFKIALQDDDWDYCVCLSNDIFELPKNWAFTFVSMMTDYSEDVGAINAYGLVNTKNGWGQYCIDQNGDNTGNWCPEDSFAYTAQPDYPNPELSTACCIMKREVLEQVGLFDEGFGMGGGMEHWDYAIRMYQKGFQNLCSARVTFKANIKDGNNFAPNDTTTYYRQKYGTHFDGISMQEFVRRARAWKA